MVHAAKIVRFKRAASVACYWNDGHFTLHNYMSRKRASAPPFVVEILDYCGEWRTPSEICARFPTYPRRPLRQLLSVLTATSFLERTYRLPAGDSDRIGGWISWTPEAALFHFSTKDVKYASQELLQARLVEKARRQPPPLPVKSYPADGRLALPPLDDSSPLASLLRQRRTWRRFEGRSTLHISQAAVLLGLTFGVQQWAHTELGPCALKTSPSGGARHPTEAYLLARRIKGVAQGCYYYDPDAHELVLLKRGLSAARLETYLAGQSCYRDVPAVVVMTSVFGRMQWRYEFSRAYRVVLLDAGHLCQTFCLVATALGLAPFCTAALADSCVERDLGLDGVSESVIYACGVGVRPAGAGWSPWPDTTAVPALSPPKSAKARHKP
jgi:SagB-type dehydrogenase family enzyme